MASSAPDRFDIFEIYRRYSDIKARNRRQRKDGTDAVKISREALGELYRLIDKSMISRDLIIGQLIRLMSQLNVKEDFFEFSNFYEFAFFILRENGQKNITVKKAIAAWKLVLSGRFRLLNQWCDFVEKNQRHNISEDTWVQVLAFSRCVHEDLEGYDPGGAWPVLIDDFVEHMYRITGSSCCISHDLACSCADPESQLFTSDDTLPGLKSFPGLKRKLRDDNQRKELDITGALSLESLSLGLNKERKDLDISGALSPESLSLELNNIKRRKQLVKERNSSDSIQLTPCAVEQCLSKGFEGLLSSHSPPLQFEKRSEC